VNGEREAFRERVERVLRPWESCGIRAVIAPVRVVDPRYRDRQGWRELAASETALAADEARRLVARKRVLRVRKQLRNQQHDTIRGGEGKFLTRKRAHLLHTARREVLPYRYILRHKTYCMDNALAARIQIKTQNTVRHVDQLCELGANVSVMGSSVSSSLPKVRSRSPFLGSTAS
jgi:hypothetical protein